MRLTPAVVSSVAPFMSSLAKRGSKCAMMFMSAPSSTSMEGLCPSTFEMHQSYSFWVSVLHA